MHIVVIPSWYKTDRQPYSGTFFEEQARALMAAGNKVRIFFPCFYTTSQLFKVKPKYDFDWNDDGLITRSMLIQGYMPHSPKFNNRYIQWQSDKMFKKYIEKDGKPDVIHAHSVFDAGIIGMSLSEKFDIPLVLTEHLTHFTGSLAGNASKLDVARNIILGTSQSIAVSHCFKEDLERELGLEESIFRVVYNMAGNLFHDTFKPRTWNPDEEFIFFTNSFLQPRKNLSLQLDALRKLVDKKCRARLVVGGTGEEENYLKQYAIKLGLENHVKFLGGLNRKRVKEEIDNSHAFLLSSEFESFGVVLIESIISGRPAISTDCGGPSEIINETNGYLVPVNDTTRYAETMEKMMQNYRHFNQQKMREECYARFSQQTIASELMKVYEDVIKKFQKVNTGRISLRQQVATLSSWLFFLE